MNGKIIEWGILSETNDFKNGRTIQLPISYTTSFAVTANWKYTGQDYIILQAYAKDNNHIVLRGDASSNLSNTSPVSWFTIGY